MYRKLLEERFGREIIAEQFGTDEPIGEIEFRPVFSPGNGAGHWDIVQDASFNEADTVGYARAMLKTVDDFARGNRKLKDKVDILVERAIGDYSDLVAMVHVYSKSEEMYERSRAVIWAAATAIREYGNRVRSAV